MSRDQAGGLPRIPQWVVTAPHHQPRALAGPHPWGVHHARQGDTQMTACGKSILSWHVFWHLGFETSHPLACADCVREVAPDLGAADRDQPAAAL